MKMACLTLTLLLGTSAAHAAIVADGTFAMMSGGSCDDLAQDCYLDDPAIAERVVDRLAAIGITRFLVPSATLSQLRIIATPISTRGLEFYTYERWTFESATQVGKFNCQKYIQERIDPVLVKLRAEFGESFAGLHFKDEPPEKDILPLAEMSQCVREDPRLTGVKLFVNLFPLHANAGSYSGSEHAGAMSPSDYGVDCAEANILQPERAAQMVARYSAFARRVSDEVRPDYLAFDIYPFTPSFGNCPTARDLLMSENMSIISNLARSRGQTPIAYLQNVQSAHPSLAQDPFEHASFHDLRWFAGWSFAFGINGFANFVTHDVSNAVSAPDGNDMLGLLDKHNNPRNLASEQQSTFGVTRQVQSALKNLNYLGFADNNLGVPSAQVSGWLSNSSFLVGEYGSDNLSPAYLVVAARTPRRVASGIIGLNRWWREVEKLDFETGTWQRVGSATNRIDVEMSTIPLELYRLRP
ncbi:hypothetical protein [Stenotrophomonas maltophilia]|uniref:hypothetical protein n=1 Tax=Stenotrophomonas maltophilia TaxID=40324 RepID=UPI0015DD6A7C|nr:hypothetical protein [Stenotrophomonas maltophilia]